MSGDQVKVDDYTTTGVVAIGGGETTVVHNHQHHNTNNNQRLSKLTEDSLLLAEASVQTAKGPITTMSSGQRNNNSGH